MALLLEKGDAGGLAVTTILRQVDGQEALPTML
jgi:hypothetical protein